jgi:hypothetical protein
MVRCLVIQLSEPVSVAPRDRIDEKTGRIIGDITKPFKLQPNNSSCETTCVTDILHELASRFEDPDLNFPLQKVNDICGYRNNVGPRIIVVIPNLRKALKAFRYYADDKVGTSHTRLRSVLVDKGCSYPIVGLSHEYLRNERDYRKENDADHTVIVLRSTGEITVVYDPFESIVPMPSRRNQNLGKGVVALKTSDFITYWKGASVSTSWSLWIRKETVMNTLLDSIMKTPEKEVLVRKQ